MNSLSFTEGKAYGTLIIKLSKTAIGSSLLRFTGTGDVMYRILPETAVRAFFRALKPSLQFCQIPVHILKLNQLLSAAENVVCKHCSEEIL